MVAHLWANQSQDNARTQRRHFSFDRRRLYSYSTQIAELTRTVSGDLVALFTSRHYSVTTNGQMSNAIRALNDTPHYRVPNISPNDATDHAANLDYLVDRMRDMLAKARSGALSNADWRLTNADHLARYATNYAASFGITAPPLSAELDAARAVHTTRVAVKEGKAKRIDLKMAEGAALTAREAADVERNARQAVLRAEREARNAEYARQREAMDAERRAAWLAHDGSIADRRGYGGNDDRGGALLRVVGDTLETSWGAEVPLRHASAVFRKVSDCRAKGTTYYRDEARPIRVGAFQVNRIDADGTLIAGCHTIHWPEIARIAASIGLLETADAA